MTTKAEITSWLERGRAMGKTHMLLMCDTFDWDDYPAYYANEAEARKAAESPSSMQKFMEAYRIDKDWKPQLDARRSYNF